MNIKIRTNQLIYIIDVEGEMDLCNSNQLKELVMKMIEKKVEHFIINVERIVSIDSSGIGAFIYISSTLKKMHLNFAIVNVRGPVREVMEKIRLTALFPLYESIDDAIKDFTAQPALEQTLV
jgi:anti-sigma B factor antagonist